LDLLWKLRFSRKLVGWAPVLCALICVPLSAGAAVVFSDDWNDLTVAEAAFAASGVDWSVESGEFSADALSPPAGFCGPQSGTLMFSPDSHARISVDFAAGGAANSVEARLKLQQSNGAAGASYAFQFGLKDTSSGQVYNEFSTFNPAYFGTSGFNSWSINGDIAAGASGEALKNGWNYLKMRFTPASGVEIWHAVDSVGTKTYDDPSLTYTSVAKWSNFRALAGVNQFYMDNSGPTGPSWRVDDVEILVLTVADTWDMDPSAVQSIYQNGVPHTDKNGNMRLAYDPELSFLPIGRGSARRTVSSGLSRGSPMPGSTAA